MEHLRIYLIYLLETGIIMFIEACFIKIFISINKITRLRRRKIIIPTHSSKFLYQNDLEWYVCNFNVICFNYHAL